MRAIDPPLTISDEDTYGVIITVYGPLNSNIDAVRIGIRMSHDEKTRPLWISHDAARDLVTALRYRLEE